MTEKLREYFDDMVVFKDLKNNSVFSFAWLTIIYSRLASEKV